MQYILNNLASSKVIQIIVPAENIKSDVAVLHMTYILTILNDLIRLWNIALMIKSMGKTT